MTLLEQQGYFKGASSGTPEHATRVGKARDKFRQRFPPANDNHAVQSTSSTTSAATTTSTATSTPTAATTTATPSAKPSAADAERAEKHKADGNALLTSKKYADAVAAYDAAIALCPDVAIYHSNKLRGAVSFPAAPRR